MVKMCDRIYKSVDTLKYFTFNHWEWSNHNLDALQAIMSEEDAKVRMKEDLGLYGWGELVVGGGEW